MSTTISTDQSLLNWEWLFASLKGSYWGGWLNDGQIIKACQNSLVFGMYLVEDGAVTKRQIGFARVVSDRATFSSVMDVFIDKEYRNHGYGMRLMKEVIAHPDVAKTICVISTKDAQGFYEQFGFGGVLAMTRKPT